MIDPNTDYEDADLIRACTRKKAYPTEKIAQGAASVVNAHGATVQTYACRRCGHWHVGAVPAAYLMTPVPVVVEALASVVALHDARPKRTGTVGRPDRHHSRQGPAARHNKGHPLREARRARAQERLELRALTIQTHAGADGRRGDDPRLPASDSGDVHGRARVAGPGDRGRGEGLPRVSSLSREEALARGPRSRVRASSSRKVRAREMRQEQD